MANGVFNGARGRVAYYASLPGTTDAIKAVLLQSSGLESDAALATHRTLASVLASNTEATFTNYARTTLTVSVTIDDSNSRVVADASDWTYVAPGGTLDNSLGKLIFCYVPDTGSSTDADIIPLTYYDNSWTTSGVDEPMTVDSSGFWRGS